MPNLFKALGAGLCLVFALSFAVPNAHADSFTYSYTEGSFSWTTGAISAVTMETTVFAADLTAASTSGFAAGCVITSITLDVSGLGGTGTNFTGCGFGGLVDFDGFTKADYSTPGTYTGSRPAQILVVTAAVATPEPSSLALMLLGVGLVFATWKRWATGLQLAS